MNFQQPVIEQMRNSIPDTKGLSEGVSNGLNSMRDGIQNTLGDFSQKNVMNASNDFLSSNGTLARFAFIILILIAFLFLLKVGITIVGFLMRPSTSPYIVQGVLSGFSTVTITQDPSDTLSVVVFRSNNEKSGIEFTWSCWLFINQTSRSLSTSAAKNPDCIFVKGIGLPKTFVEKGPANYYTTNGPGWYVDNDVSGSCQLTFIMDTIDNSQNIIKVLDIPQQKWFHVAYRLQNKVIDVYVNGTIANRTVLPIVPKQNYYDILVCPNGGFPGNLSNLRYYDHALTVFEINNIIAAGPNMTASALSADSKAVSGNYSFLSNSWYYNKL
jgi:hypothetical protein